MYSLFSVTGKVPFPGGDSRSKCRRHCEQTPWHPRRFPRTLRGFVDVIADMMEKDQSDVCTALGEVVERLEGLELPDGVVELPLERQVWTPPPPPKEPSQLRDSLDSGSQHPPQGSPSQSGVEAGVQSESSLVPLIPQDDAGTPSEMSQANLVTRRSGYGVAVAIALAIAIPVSLFIGAVIGFLVRGALQ